MQRHMSRYQASIKPSLSIIRLLLIATAIVAPIAFVIKLHIIKIHGIRYLAGFGALYVIKLSISVVITEKRITLIGSKAHCLNIF